MRSFVRTYVLRSFLSGLAYAEFSCIARFGFVWANKWSFSEKSLLRSFAFIGRSRSYTVVDEIKSFSLSSRSWLC